MAAVIVYGEHVERHSEETGIRRRNSRATIESSLLFMTIYGGFGRLEVMRRSCFHFDKTQDVQIPASKIEFAAICGER